MRRQQARSLLLQLPNAAPHRQPAPSVNRQNRQVELQRASLQHPRGPSFTALRPVLRWQTRTGLSSTKCASSATGALLTTRSTAQGGPLHPDGSDFSVSSGPVFPAQGTWCRRPDGLDLHSRDQVATPWRGCEGGVLKCMPLVAVHAICTGSFSAAL